MDEQTLHIQIREGQDLTFWRQKAMNVIRAECLKQEVEWRDLQIIVELPQPGLVLTKDKGHGILITRHL